MQGLCDLLVIFQHHSGAVCGNLQLVSHTNASRTKELHGTYSLDGDHQQRSGRRTTRNCPRETSLDSRRCRGMLHQAKPGSGRATELKERKA